MILAVDAGNSRVKWGLHDRHTWTDRGWAPNADIATLERAWIAMPAPARIIISNVAGDISRRRLEQLFLRWTVPLEWITASAKQCGVCNAYDNPAQLGSDRWAALIAAWRRCAGSCVVVNAGTAVTVDALSDDGIFLGGMIVPGLTAMQRALACNTAQLPVATGYFSNFPRNTADAIHSGALSAIVGAIEKMVAILDEKHGKVPTCLISGGDAILVRERLSVDAVILDNLVLDGLIEIARS